MQATQNHSMSATANRVRSTQQIIARILLTVLNESTRQTTTKVDADSRRFSDVCLLLNLDDEVSSIGPCRKTDSAFPENSVTFCNENVSPCRKFLVLG